MNASILRLWHRISHLPFLGVIRPPAPVEPGASPNVALDQVAFTFRECEDDCGPSANELQAQERERAERFKRDQLLPIMGLTGGSPSPPS